MKNKCIIIICETIRKDKQSFYKEKKLNLDMLIKIYSFCFASVVPIMLEHSRNFAQEKITSVAIVLITYRNKYLRELFLK